MYMYDFSMTILTEHVRTALPPGALTFGHILAIYKRV